MEQVVEKEVMDVGSIVERGEFRLQHFKGSTNRIEYEKATRFEISQTNLRATDINFNKLKGSTQPDFYA
ncbi:unnamed protein product [Dovyalis caffra]|uniref:Uncharacterized protein n=1 Tax=Dovyalis caffra TaxID=77055 RepID=A0AAV1RJQ2_9ROSI|nr:unnamed protein product [Dovyalis caffra]